jgi:hypothetical protein
MIAAIHVQKNAALLHAYGITTTAANKATINIQSAVLLVFKQLTADLIAPFHGLCK